MIEESICKINALKMSGEIYRSWSAKLLDETDDYWLFVGEFEKEVRHTELGVIRSKTVSYEYYWKNRWFNVFRFHEPEGNFKYFYCNINKPPQFSNYILEYIDLEIDVLVKKDFSYQVLDLDEFEINSKLLNYNKDIHTNVENSLKELLMLVENRLFPFDFVEETD